MCDPVSLTLAATIGAGAMSAGSSIFGGIMQSQQQQYAAKVADQNAEMAQRNAAIVQKESEDDQRTQYQKVAALKGHQIAAFAAEGLDVSFGSPADVVGDTALLGEQDAQRIRDNAMAKANSYILDANNYKAQAAGDRSAGTADLVGGLLKAGSTALTTATQIPGLFGGKSPNTKLA